MITRDSKLWWLVMAGAVLTAIASDVGLLHQAFPGLSPAIDAQIKLFSMLVGVVSGVMRMSPLPISPEGRIDAVKKDTAVLSKASTERAVASAVATADAVEAQSKLGR